MSSNDSPFKKSSANPFFQGVIDVSPEEVFENLQNVLLVDVRQPDEFTGELGHIASSKLIPLGTFPQHLSSLPEESIVVLICRSGNRSAQAAAFAQENGIPNMYNMAGGMIAWNEKGLVISREEPTQ